MFKIEAKKCFKIRKALIHAYQVSGLGITIVFQCNNQEQGKGLDVVFKCEDGEQRCSRLALQFMSDFYTDQLEGRDRMGNGPIFTYEYPKVRNL